MKTSIVLSDGKSVYHSGDKVSGLIKISATSNVDIAKISISLQGFIQTHIVFVKYWHSQSNFKKRVLLFTREIPIFIGPYTLKPGDHDWPFEFTIPEHCEKHESQEFHDKKSSIFDDDADQDLPPATPEVLSRNFSTSGNSFSITYPLTASIMIGKLLGSKQEDIVQDLNIQPWRDVSHPTWRSVSQICKFQTFVGDDTAVGKRRPSIFQRRGSVQQEPNFSFSLNAKIATTTIIGKPVPMFLSLQHDTPPNFGEHAAAPKFEIKSISATLSVDNIVRSQGSHQELYLSGSPESMWSETTSIGSKLTMPIPIENGDTLDVRSLIMDFSIPATETSSFFSFAVCRLHEMKFKVEIECNGQSFTASYTTKRTIVLPEHSRSDVKSNKTDKEAAEADYHLTDRRNDSFAEPYAGEHEPPPSFGVATSGGDELPGYSRDGTY